MSKYDVTKLNVGIDKLLAVTTNQGIVFFSKRIPGTGTWKLQVATKKFLRRK
jgi:hypothetical protein